MTLEAVRLDNVNWREMVEGIRGRIAAVSGEQWTLHSPIDPGVTLLELFAYLLEQRIYWLDQMPPSLLIALLALLNEEPQQTQVATTLLCFKPEDDQAALDLAQGTEMRLGADPSICFRTDAGLALLPIRHIELHTDDGDRTRDLDRGWQVRLFPAIGTAAEFKLVIWLETPLSNSPRQEPLVLFFDIDTGGTIPPQWSTKAVSDVPPPATLRWHYSGPVPGFRRPFAIDQIEDGTGGFRRSGLIRITIPEDWTPAAQESLGYAYCLWVSTREVTLSSPPLLHRLIPNVAIAKHQCLIDSPFTELDTQARTWLPLPGYELQLPFDLPAPIEQSIELRLRERDGTFYQWRVTHDFARHGPEDRVFTVDRERRRIAFGDGLTGRLPVLDRSADVLLQLRYFAGGGESGNLGRNLTWVSRGKLILKAVNPVPAEGGAEPETPTAARARAAASMHMIERAITASDYEVLATTTPGVAVQRAHAAVGYHPGFPCVPVPGAVTVFIVPSAPRGEATLADSVHVAAPQPDLGMLHLVQTRLNERRLLTTEVYVRGIRYVPVSVAVTVAANSEDQVLIRERVQQELASYLDPLIGGASRTGWPFGEPVRPSELLREAQAALGVRGAVERLAIGIHGATATEDCQDVRINPHELVYLHGLQLELRQQAPTTGGLR
jgi:hypothetical protein